MQMETEVDAEIELECPVCYEPYEPVKTVCNHKFCSQCLSKVDTCPLCRTRLNPKNPYLTMQFNGHNRFATRHSPYYGQITNGIYLPGQIGYGQTFALMPEDHQPTGPRVS